MNYPWYEKLNNKSGLQIIQGEIVQKCPIIVPPATIDKDSVNEVKIMTYNVIVITQSCDLMRGSVENVLVCPFFYWSTVIKTIDKSWQNAKGYEKFWNNLKKGAEPSYHLLINERLSNFNEPIIVDFSNVFGINISCLIEHLKSYKKRIRLLPPYREHLAQAFARYFMRVGLPQDIPGYREALKNTKLG